MPVAYPASCSPQAWSAASVLLLVRTCSGSNRRQTAPPCRPVRPDLSAVADLSLERLEFAGRPMSVTVQDGRGRVTLA